MEFQVCDWEADDLDQEEEARLTKQKTIILNEEKEAANIEKRVVQNETVNLLGDQLHPPGAIQENASQFNDRALRREQQLEEDRRRYLEAKAATEKKVAEELRQRSEEQKDVVTNHAFNNFKDMIEKMMDQKLQAFAEKYLVKPEKKKVQCDICGKEFSAKGIAKHRSRCHGGLTNA